MGFAHRELAPPSPHLTIGQPGGSKRGWRLARASVSPPATCCPRQAVGMPGGGPCKGVLTGRFQAGLLPLVTPGPLHLTSWLSALCLHWVCPSSRCHCWGQARVRARTGQAWEGTVRVGVAFRNAVPAPVPPQAVHTQVSGGTGTQHPSPVGEAGCCVVAGKDTALFHGGH